MLDRLANTIPTVTIGITTPANSTEIVYSGYAHGRIYVPTGSIITLLAWYDAEKPGGTYLASLDADGVAVTQTVAAAKSYPIPDALSGARAIKAVGDAAGTIAVSLKG